jgi:hypothetical protein
LQPTLESLQRFRGDECPHLSWLHILRYMTCIAEWLPLLTSLLCYIEEFQGSERFPILFWHNQELVGDDLEKALQVKTKKARGKAIGEVEQKLIRLLTSESGQLTIKVEDQMEELVWDEERDGVLMLEDGEVDEGDIHVRPGSQIPKTEVRYISLQ